MIRTGLALAAVIAALPAHAEEPPPPLTITLAAPSPVLGVDEESEVRVDVADGVPPPRALPRLSASTGRVEDLVRTGPRSFTGRYLLPAERFPQIAILVAELAESQPPVRAFVVVRLRAAASPAFRTDPGASVTLRIGDKEFGPIRAQRDGTVRVPVVVPPGIGFGVARSVNQFGEGTEQTVDLRIPPFRRVMLAAAPPVLTAGTTRELAVYAVDSAGMPVEPGAVVLRASAGKPQPLGGRPGEARFLVRVEATVAGPLHLEAALRDQPAIGAAVDLPVVPGPTRRLVLRPDRARLPAAVGASMRVYLAGQDQFGNSTDAADVTVLVDGVPVGTRAGADGQVVAVVAAPPSSVGRDHIEVEAALGAAYAIRRIPIGTPIPAATGPRDGPPRLTVTPRLGVLVGPRRPPAASLRLEALGRGERWPPWLLVGVGAGLLLSELLASDSLGVSEISLLQIPILAEVRYQHQLVPRLLLAATAGAGAMLSRVRVRSFGRRIPGQRLAPAAELGGEAAVRIAPGQLVVGLRYLFATVGRLSSGDRLIGNLGGLVGDLGFRLAW